MGSEMCIRDSSMLEDMVLGAVNQALDKGRETQSAEMGKLTGGMGGGMGLPGL